VDLLDAVAWVLLLLVLLPPFFTRSSLKEMLQVPHRNLKTNTFLQSRRCFESSEKKSSKESRCRRPDHLL
jgi:hypothetical protein